MNYPNLKDLVRIGPLKTQLDVFVMTLAIWGKQEIEIAEILQAGISCKSTPKGLNVHCWEHEYGGLLSWYHRFRKSAWILSYKRDYLRKNCSLYCNGFLWKIPSEYDDSWPAIFWVVRNIKIHKHLLEKRKIIDLGIDLSKFKSSLSDRAAP